MRVYLDGSVPAPVVGELERLGAQLVRADDPAMGGGIGGMFWRFLVAADEQVDRFIVRDSDSRLNARERLAVEEWIASGTLTLALTLALALTLTLTSLKRSGSRRARSCTR